MDSEKSFVYTVFAGVNGAGKSTLFEIVVKENYGIRINTDEIVGKDWRDSKAQIRAGRKALELREEAFKNKKSLNQETTLTGKGIIKAIKYAKSIGYKVVMFYVGVDTPEIAQERVKERVLKGGHGIPKETIEKRYYESLENFKKIKNTCDEIHIYDNSSKFKEMAEIKNGVNFIIKKELTKWVENVMELKKEMPLEKETGNEALVNLIKSRAKNKDKGNER